MDLINKVRLRRGESGKKSHNPSLCSFLRGLELVQIQKELKKEFGGGTKEFTVAEVRCCGQTIKFCQDMPPN